MEWVARIVRQLMLTKKEGTTFDVVMRPPLSVNHKDRSAQFDVNGSNGRFYRVIVIDITEE